MSWKAATLTLLGQFNRVTVERAGATPPTLEVRGRVYNYSPDELVGGITQLDRKGIIYADDVTWTPRLRKGDRVRYTTEDGTRLLNVEEIDDVTTRVANEDLVLYRVRLK